MKVEIYLFIRKTNFNLEIIVLYSFFPKELFYLMDACNFITDFCCHVFHYLPRINNIHCTLVNNFIGILLD